MKHYIESTRNIKYLNKELIVNALRAEYPEYSRKPWGVMANLIARGNKSTNLK